MASDLPDFDTVACLDGSWRISDHHHAAQRAHGALRRRSRAAILTVEFSRSADCRRSRGLGPEAKRGHVKQPHGFGGLLAAWHDSSRHGVKDGRTEIPISRMLTAPVLGCSYPAAVSRDAVEHVLIGENPVSLCGGHHSLAQQSEPPHEQEVFQRLAHDVAAGNAYCLAILSSSRRTACGRLIVTVSRMVY